MPWEELHNERRLLEKRKEELEERLDVIEAELRLLSLEPLYILAELLHCLFCHSNHVDGCSWDYESWNGLVLGKSPLRQKYVTMASTFCNNHSDLDSAISQVEFLLKLKKDIIRATHLDHQSLDFAWDDRLRSSE